MSGVLKYLFTDVKKPVVICHKFKLEHSYDVRLKKSASIMTKHGDSIPIIVERNTDMDPQLKGKNMFLIKNDCTLGQFIKQMRRHIEVDPHDTLLVTMGGSSVYPVISSVMKDLYTEYKDEDGFLYINYGKSPMFG